MLNAENPEHSCSKMSKAYVPRGLNHFKPVLKGIKEKLQELGYKTFFGVLNSKNYKVAQDRKRLFIVAVREDSYRRPFKWPKSQGARSLTSVLDPETSEDVPGRLPANKRSKELALTVYKKVFNDHKVDPRKTPVAIDVGCSKSFLTYGVDIARTLSKSRAESGGFWISSRRGAFLKFASGAASSSVSACPALSAG